MMEIKFTEARTIKLTTKQWFGIPERPMTPTQSYIFWQAIEEKTGMKKQDVVDLVN